MSSASSSTGRRRQAGAFDIRNIIGALIGFYGVVLVITGLVNDTAAERAKTGDVNANLWAGLGMVAFGLVFFAWSWLRPVVVDEEAVAGDEDGPAGT
ncbi:hypothetical protein [Blastococcus sp. SYSU DS0533]